MTFFSSYAGQATLGQWFGGTPAVVPTILYVALLTAGSVELSGSGYARVAVANNAGSWSTPTGTAPETVSNAAIVQFPLASGNWAAATQFAIYDAASGGNQIGIGPLGGSLSVPSGQQAQFAIGALVISLS